MHYRIDENRVFADSADELLVALMTDTGTYFTFNPEATAIVEDLCSGFDDEELIGVLKEKYPDIDVEMITASFLKKILQKGILTASTENRVSDSGMKCRELTPGSRFAPEAEEFDDVAEYFAIDPIHEVKPEMGWPNVR